MAFDDIAGVLEDENDYPPVRSNAMTPPTFGGSPVPVRPPVGAAPDVGYGDAPAIPVTRPDGPSFKDALTGTIGTRPDSNAAEYQPVQRPLWQTILGGARNAIVGAGNPKRGAELRDEFDPTKAARAKYTQDLGDYEGRLKDAMEIQREETDEPLKRAQTGEAEARAEALRNPPTKERPEPSEGSSVESGGQAFQWNPETHRYDIPVGNPKAEPTKNPETRVMGNRTMQWDGTKWIDAGPAPEREGAEGTWSLQEGPNGEPVLLNSKSGATRPARDVEKTGTRTKALDTATQKRDAADRQADLDHQAGKIDDRGYWNQRATNLGQYAQTLRASRQTPTADTGVAHVYFQAYGNRATAIAAMERDGWTVPNK